MKVGIDYKGINLRDLNPQWHQKYPLFDEWHETKEDGDIMPKGTVTAYRKGWFDYNANKFRVPPNVEIDSETLKIIKSINNAS